MNGIRFFMTDVFGGEKYSGNQLATFLDGGRLTEREMQRIAREFNFSETTFVLSDKKESGGYAVRIFTPGKEIDFAGHPTLGTAYIIRRHLIRDHADAVVLNLRIGRIPVSFSGSDGSGPLWMDQAEPRFGKVFDAASTAEMLRLPADAIDGRFPVQEVSTGLPHMIVPLRNLEALQEASPDKERYFAIIRDVPAKCVLIFCPEGRDGSHGVSVRMFADYLGIAEDPATGSGNGCLAAYLSHHRFFGSDRVDLRAGQGHEIGRPSLLMLKAHETDSGGTAVSVGGNVIPISEGTWYL
ncbi:MAG: PhzF family phenazine biosynthesis protein [Spirochaetes bacterium]|nr:PhzF family phenazine biosynthesis protein [Spirochaetota bacterium]